MSSDLDSLYHVIENTNNIIMSLAELKKDNVINADNALKITNFISQAQTSWTLDKVKRTTEDAKIHSFIDDIKNITIGPITDNVVELESNIQEADKVTCSECGADMHRIKGLLLASYPPQYKYVCSECNHVSYRTV